MHFIHSHLKNAIYSPRKDNNTFGVSKLLVTLYTSAFWCGKEYHNYFQQNN